MNPYIMSVHHNPDDGAFNSKHLEMHLQAVFSDSELVFRKSITVQLVFENGMTLTELQEAAKEINAPANSKTINGYTYNQVTAIEVNYSKPLPALEVILTET